MVSFVEKGLEDLCVSRTTFDWGVQVKENPKHVVYVWLDALLNYITALGYDSANPENYLKFWQNGNEKVHVLGKDITRFHLLYWPIFLMALDLPLPDKFLVHGWVVMKDGKMSKSKGNVIYPETLINRYGLDATKYLLLRELGFGQDTVFTPEGFIDRFNFDLCNDLGNLLNRTIGMINKYFGGSFDADLSLEKEIDGSLHSFVSEKIDLVEKNMDGYRVNDAIVEIWNIVSRINKYIDETAPWVLAKEENKDYLAVVMYNLVDSLRKIAILISPFMKETAKKMFDQLLINDDEVKTWDSLRANNILKTVKVIEKGEPLFMRLDVEEELEYIQNEMHK